MALEQAMCNFCFGSLQSTCPSFWPVLFLLLAGHCLLLTHEFDDSSFYSIARSLNKVRSEEVHRGNLKTMGNL